MDPAAHLPPARVAGSRAILSGVFAAALALGLSFALSLNLRRLEARSSHQQPTPEAWFEVATRTSPALIAEGRTLYLDSCAHCHAADATGDEGPDLHAVEASDRYIANIITHGIKGEMPSFQKKLGPEDIVRLTAYVRSLD